jgi:hypothetical protein
LQSYVNSVVVVEVTSDQSTSPTGFRVGMRSANIRKQSYKAVKEISKVELVCFEFDTEPTTFSVKLSTYRKVRQQGRIEYTWFILLE